MNLILSIITFLALLFYTAIEIKFQLQMMQQNTYRNDRYNRWLKGESFASVSRLVDLFLLLLLSTNFLPLFVQIVAITVALYKSVNHLKAKLRRQRHLAEPEAETVHGDTPEDALLRQEQAERLQGAIARLSETDRKLFYRRYYYLQPVAQIAAEMGMTERAAEGRLYRLRQRLRRELGGDAP